MRFDLPLWEADRENWRNIRRKIVESLIENLNSFQDLFHEILKQKNLNNNGMKYNSISFSHSTDYHRYHIKAIINENQLINVVTEDYEVDDIATNTQFYSLNSDRKIRFPNKIWKEYEQSVGLEKEKNDLFLEILESLGKHRIFIQFDTLRYTPFKSADAMDFWCNKKLDFNAFKIRVHACSTDNDFNKIY